MFRKICSLAIVSMLTCLMIIAVLSFKGTATSLPVHNLETGLNYATINEAIKASETHDGHTILVDAGVYHESVELEGKSVKIIGENQNTTIIEAGNNIGIYCTGLSNFRISRLTIKESIGALTLDSCRDFTISYVTMYSLGFTGIYTTNCTNGVVNNCYVATAWGGIELDGARGTSLMDNVITRNDRGLILWNSENITMRGNLLSDNLANLCVDTYGSSALLSFDVDSSNMINNRPVYWFVNERDRVIRKENVGFLALVDCLNFTVEGLNLTRNGQGVLLVGTNNTILRSNMIAENVIGIDFVDSDDNEIYENAISMNKKCGISLISSNGNRIYHNSIEGWNTDDWLFSHAYASVTSSNVWDDGYPSGGNYWSNYTDIDQKSGPHQDRPGADGIWDHSYSINGNNTDNYPLVNRHGITSMFNVFWKGALYTVTASCDGWAGWFNFDNISKTMSLEVMNSSFVDIAMPKELLDGAMRVSVNDETVSSILTWNGTHTTVSLRLNSSQSGIIKVKAEFATRFPIQIFPDINNDGVVDILDITIVALHFRETR